MRIDAAVLVEPGHPLELVELELSEPRRDEVLVRMHASGICHSDLSYVDGTWPIPLPIVLGHEGAGEIVAVGKGVNPERVGERVVLTFAPACGACRFCLEGRVNLCQRAAEGLDRGVLRDGTTRLRWAGQPVHHLAFVSSFASHAVVPAGAAIAISAPLDPTLACLLGCGVTTGVLSVTRRAAVRPGDSVAVFGCGGVGLAAIQGARLVSAYPIVAVDPQRSARDLAVALGATHAVGPKEALDLVSQLTPAGIDYSFEAVGRPEAAAQAFAVLRTGGTTVLIGQPAIGVNAPLPTYDITQFEQTVLGSNLGSASPALHIPVLADLAARGALDLGAMVTDRFALERVNEAIRATAAGGSGRVVLELS